MNPHHHPSRNPRQSRRAFTLIELIVVIIILALAAGLLAPRLLRSRSAAARTSVDAITTLLSIAAHRDSIGAAPVSIAYDPAQPALTLRTRAPSAQSTHLAAWRNDHFIAPVTLSPLILRSALLDGRDIMPGPWTIDFPRHQPRPTIELHLEQPRDSGSPTSRWTILLLPGWTAARAADDLASNTIERPIDLDAAGNGDASW